VQVPPRSCQMVWEGKGDLSEANVSIAVKLLDI
jgi:hypothetical protein